MTCGTCKWLDVPPDSDGKRRARKDNIYKCLAPVSECPPLPDCITRAGWHNVRRSFQWPPDRSYVTTDMGASCPLRHAREKSA